MAGEPPLVNGGSQRSAPNYVRDCPPAVTARPVVIADHASRLTVAPIQKLAGVPVNAEQPPCICRGGECRGRAWSGCNRIASTAPCWRCLLLSQCRSRGLVTLRQRFVRRCHRGSAYLHHHAISYITIPNVHVLEQAIRTAFKRPGMRALSDVLASC